MTTTAIRSLSLSSRLVAGLAVFLVGMTFVVGVGFANDLAAHNGAHDYRHSMNFPCH